MRFLRGLNCSQSGLRAGDFTRWHEGCSARSRAPTGWAAWDPDVLAQEDALLTSPPSGLWGVARRRHRTVSDA